MSDCTCMDRCKNIEAFAECYGSMTPTMHNIRRAFVALLKTVYSDANNFAEYSESMSGLTYSDDSTETNLSITPAYSDDPDDTASYPKIVVGFSDGVGYNLPTLNQTSVRRPDYAGTIQTTLGTVNLTMKCIHIEPALSCIMCDICSLVIHSLGEKFRRMWRTWLLDIRITSQSDATQRENSDGDLTNLYESTLVIKMDYSYNTSVVEESKRLKATSVNNKLYKK